MDPFAHPANANEKATTLYYITLKAFFLAQEKAYDAHEAFEKNPSPTAENAYHSACFKAIAAERANDDAYIACVNSR